MTGPHRSDDASAPTVEGADRFAVGLHRTESELEFVVRVPSDIDSAWRSPAEFQQLIEQITWTHLDQASTLRTVATETEPGETVTLGTVTLQPDGTLVDHSLSSPADANSSQE